MDMLTPHGEPIGTLAYTARCGVCEDTVPFPTTYMIDVEWTATTPRGRETAGRAEMLVCRACVERRDAANVVAGVDAKGWRYRAILHPPTA